MAMEAARAGGSMPTVFNAANELAVTQIPAEKNQLSGYLRDYRAVYGADIQQSKDPDLDQILAD